MDQNQYKSIQTLRGYTYSYYVANEQAMDTILFLHGFPSTSRDWVEQVKYFSTKGYKIIAPDLLGYGKTSKPTDPTEYKLRHVANDVIDILDAEQVSKTIVVAHDWGCVLSSRLINFHQERLVGVAFLANAYNPPQPDFNYETTITTLNSLFGYDVLGYWEYFAASDAPRDLIFPKDPLIWKTNLTPMGKAREWIENNKQTPLPSYWDTKSRAQHQERLLSGGLHGPMNWYTSIMKGLNIEDESQIPQSQYTFSIPCFFGAALQDYICIPTLNTTMMANYATNLVTEEFDTSHWIMFEAPTALNLALDKFISRLKSGVLR